MKIGNKLFYTAMIFMIPAIVMIYFILSGIEYDIRFSTLEKHGNNYQKPVLKIFKLFSDYTTARLNGNNEPIKDLTEQIDKNFEQLKNTDLKIGKDLQFTDDGLSKRNISYIKYDNFLELWQSIKSDDSIDKNKCNQFIAIIRKIISHSGDTSNLILDPDLDSYYLMDITLLSIPQTLERYYTLIINDSLTRDELFLLRSHIYESDYLRIAGDGNTSLNEDKNFYGESKTLQANFRAALKDYDRSTLEFLDNFAAFIDGNITRKIFLDNAKITMDKNFTFWEKTVNELDILLDKRIDFYKRQRFFSLGFSLLSFLLAGGIMFFVGFSILNPVKKILAAIQKTNSGDLTGNINLRSQDEIGEIAGTFNNLIKSLNRVISSLKNMSDKSNKMGTNLTASSEEISATLEEINSNTNSVTEQMDLLNRNVEVSNKAGIEISQTLGSLIEIINKQKNVINEASSVVMEMIDSINHLSRISMTKQESASSLIALADIGEKELKNNSILINKIYEEVKSVSEFTEMINSISSATNLLAMNAGIEAAHAGDSGKGFSVVAKEIRKLSINTADYSRKISGITKNILDNVNTTQEMIKKTAVDVTSVLHGIKDISRTLQTTTDGLIKISANTNKITGYFEKIDNLSDIVGSSSSVVENKVKEIDDIIKDILNLSGDTFYSIKEISLGVNEISKSVSFFTEMTSENADTVTSLNNEISTFKTLQ